MRPGLVIALLAVLTACVSERPNFLTMSEEELYTYNSEQPLRDQVYCFERQHTRSWIPRRHCATVQELAQETERAAGQLYTLSPSTGFSAFGASRD